MQDIIVRTKTKTFFILIIMFFTSAAINVKAGDMPYLIYILPGSTHFYEGDILTGSIFAAGEVSALATGIAINGRLDQSTSEWNLPLLFAGQLYIIDKWSYLQKENAELKERAEENRKNFNYDAAPYTELLKAPFKPEVVCSPFVFLMAGLGILDGASTHISGTKTFSDIFRVHAMGNNMSRDQGTLYYESMSLMTSYGAGVSEEMAFRGIIMPVLDYEFGKETGLVITAFTFGAAHALNPGLGNPLSTVVFTTLAGLALGHEVQDDNYKIEKAVAGHFWYDFLTMTTAWLLDPASNSIGIGVSFKI